MPNLTTKQAKFVNAYLGEAEGNATEAAFIAGYSGTRKALCVTGSQNLVNPNIRQAIDNARERAELRCEKGRGWRIEKLIAIIEDPDNSTNDKLKSIDILNKMHGEYVQRHEHTSVDMPMDAQIVRLREIIVSVEGERGGWDG